MPKDELDLSAVIITLNEEENLPRCLASLPKNIEIIVVDSGSNDRTTDIARQHGAKVFAREFDDYSSQKNFALSKANRGWILSIDADEILEASLAKKITDVVGQNSSQLDDAFKLKRRLVFMGRTMRFGRTTDYPIRLLKKDSASFVGIIHEKLELKTGKKLGCLSGGSLHHYSYANLEDYFAKFNQYTSRVAQKKFASGSANMFGFFQLLRPWYEFFVRYFIRLGLLDGYEGYCYAFLSSSYKFVNYAKLRELQKART